MTRGLLLLTVSSSQTELEQDWTLIDMSAWAPDFAQAPRAVTISDQLGLKGLAPPYYNLAEAAMNIRMSSSDVLLDVLCIHDVHVTNDTVLGDLTAKGRMRQHGVPLCPCLQKERPPH